MLLKYYASRPNLYLLHDVDDGEKTIDIVFDKTMDWVKFYFIYNGVNQGIGVPVAKAYDIAGNRLDGAIAPPILLSDITKMGDPKGFVTLDSKTSIKKITIELKADNYVATMDSLTSSVPEPSTITLFLPPFFYLVFLSIYRKFKTKI